MENQKISLPPPSPTAYDDAFRTMLNDCSALIIPVVNLYFNETYTGNEEITLSKTRTRLDDLQRAGEIDGFMKKAIYTMINHVMALIDQKYENVRK